MKKAFEKRLRSVYGNRAPGSQGRWVAQEPEREQHDRMTRERLAWALYRRVHGAPCAAEQQRLDFEAETKQRFRGAVDR